MDDLVHWSRAQFDEDERIARAARDAEFCKDGRWILKGPFEDELGGVHSEAGEALLGEEESVPFAMAEHIVRHDPARVLRDIDAKRQMLDDYEVTARIRDEAATRIKAAGDHPNPKDLETWDRAQREAAILEGPVKLAATPLSDRPGYLESWRPA